MSGTDEKIGNHGRDIYWSTSRLICKDIQLINREALNVKFIKHHCQQLRKSLKISIACGRA